MVGYTGLPGNYTGVSQEILGYKLQLHTSLILLIISVGMYTVVPLASYDI